MPKDTRRKFSFVATDEGNNKHTLHVFVDIIDVGNFENPDEEVEGMKTIMTVDGFHVNRKAPGKYEVVGTGLVLHSSDPLAP